MEIPIKEVFSMDSSQGKEFIKTRLIVIKVTLKMVNFKALEN
jgi:hypothetical protein